MKEREVAMIQWWSRGQRYEGPNGEELIRVSNCLYLARPEDEGLYYELAVIKDESNYGHDFDRGVFHFEDCRTGEKGTLVCTQFSGSVQFEGEESSTIWGMSHPAGEFARVRLFEFDHRQVPAMMYRINDHAQVVYFSAGRHSCFMNDGLPLTVDRMFIVDFHDGTRQTVTEVEDLKVESWEERRALNVRTQWLGTLYLTHPHFQGNGQWGESKLHRLELEDYIIVHDDATGKLVSVTPKV